jgi:hypothetical protein
MPDPGFGRCDGHHEMVDLGDAGEPVHSTTTCPEPVWPHQSGKGGAMKLNDDAIVAWVCHGQRNTTTVAAARKMLRAAYPDWVDDKIEQELFALIVSKGRAQR